MPLESKYLDLVASAIPAADQAAIRERLSLLYDRVVITNEKINITSLVAPIDVTLKHFVDSLTLFSDPLFLRLTNRENKICDIGCGGGFPGLPVACVCPDVPITMVDSTEKKITALKENVNFLGLSNVFPIWGRGEDLAGKNGSHREQYDVCVSRAVAALPVLCELCLPFVRKGGYFFAMKGMKAQEELKDSLRAIPMLGGSLKEVKEITLDFPESLASFSEDEQEKIRSFSEAKRYLIVIEKKKATQPQFPRKWAQMAKKPL